MPMWFNEHGWGIFRLSAGLEGLRDLIIAKRCKKCSTTTAACIMVHDAQGKEEQDIYIYMAPTQLKKKEAICTKVSVANNAICTWGEKKKIGSDSCSWPRTLLPVSSPRPRKWTMSLQFSDLYTGFLAIKKWFQTTAVLQSTEWFRAKTYFWSAARL